MKGATMRFDGKKVVNYAQWKSMADFQAMQRNPKARAHIEAVAALGHPGLADLLAMCGYFTSVALAMNLYRVV